MISNGIKASSKASIQPVLAVLLIIHASADWPVTIMRVCVCVNLIRKAIKLSHCSQYGATPSSLPLATTKQCTGSANLGLQRPREGSWQDSCFFQLLTCCTTSLTLISPGYACSCSCSGGLDGGRKASSAPIHCPALGHGDWWSWACHHTTCKDVGSLTVTRPEEEKLRPRSTKVPASQWFQQQECISKPLGMNLGGNSPLPLAEKHCKPEHWFSTT